jgi:hypothetical protein
MEGNKRVTCHFDCFPLADAPMVGGTHVAIKSAQGARALQLMPKCGRLSIMHGR